MRDRTLTPHTSAHTPSEITSSDIHLALVGVWSYRVRVQGTDGLVDSGLRQGLGIVLGITVWVSNDRARVNGDSVTGTVRGCG